MSGFFLLDVGHLPFSQSHQALGPLSDSSASDARLRKEMASFGLQMDLDQTCVWLAEGVGILTSISLFQLELCLTDLGRAIILAVCVPGLVAGGNLSCLLRATNSKQMVSERADPEAIFGSLLPHSRARSLPCYHYSSKDGNQGGSQGCSSKEDRHFLCPSISKSSPSAKHRRTPVSCSLVPNPQHSPFTVRSSHQSWELNWLITCMQTPYLKHA